MQDRRTEKMATCDICRQQQACEDLFVINRVLELELTYSQDPLMAKRFDQLKTRLVTLGFAYPYGQSACLLPTRSLEWESAQREARLLLHQLRQKVRLYS